MSERLTTNIDVDASVPAVLLDSDDAHEIPNRLDNFCKLRRILCPVISCNTEADASRISSSGELIVGLMCESEDGRGLAGCLSVSDDPVVLQEKVNIAVNSSLVEVRPEFSSET